MKGWAQSWVTSADEGVTRVRSGRVGSGSRVVLTVLYAVNVAISYLLMLAVMTYNVGYFVIIVLGLAIGHFVFFCAASPMAAPDVCCAAALP